MKLKWLACELHTHTLHSDGRQTLSELAAGAVKLGFDAIALTDHNTMSGLFHKEDVARESGLLILPGMEWTTFYGHMVTLGLDAFADWREADRYGVGEGIEAVHRHGGLAGLAHPFRIGSPACTGCFWEYELSDWSTVDYIEVWSGTFAPIQTGNQRAYALWTDKLNEGYRIAATSGRDWHAQEDTEEPISVTYLGVPDDVKPAEEHLVQALRQGRASVTIGPLLGLALDIGDERYELGSAVPPDMKGGEIRARVSLDFAVRPGLWTLPDQTYRLMLRSNQGFDAVSTAHAGLGEYVLPVHDVARKWLRAELWGNVRGANTLIAFTNAIYFDEGVNADEAISAGHRSYGMHGQ